MIPDDQVDEPAEELSLVDELMAMDPANLWAGPVWITGSVAHCYRDCRDMRQTAHTGPGIDPDNPRPNGPKPCKYCLDREENS